MTQEWEEEAIKTKQNKTNEINKKPSEKPSDKVSSNLFKSISRESETAIISPDVYITMHRL